MINTKKLNQVLKAKKNRVDYLSDKNGAVWANINNHMIVKISRAINTDNLETSATNIIDTIKGGADTYKPATVCGGVISTDYIKKLICIKCGGENVYINDYYLSIFNTDNCIIKAYNKKTPVIFCDNNGDLIGIVCAVCYNGGTN